MDLIKMMWAHTQNKVEVRSVFIKSFKRESFCFLKSGCLGVHKISFWTTFAPFRVRLMSAEILRRYTVK